eukprot:ANDGO_01480.mRNA.1 E3 ubiquitin-protein ligase RING1-like
MSRASMRDLERMSLGRMQEYVAHAMDCRDMASVHRPMLRVPASIDRTGDDDDYGDHFVPARYFGLASMMLEEPNARRRPSWALRPHVVMRGSAGNGNGDGGVEGTYESLLELDRHNVRVGLSDDAKRRIPTRVVCSSQTRARISDSRSGNSGSPCTVCFESLAVGQMVCDLVCGHSFHKECLFRWFEDHKTCPVCRLEIH